MKRLNPRIAGKLRKVQVGVMTKNGFKEAINHKDIKKELTVLCKNASFICCEEDIKKWHIKFEKIHPFEDGKSRKNNNEPSKIKNKSSTFDNSQRRGTI